MIEFAIKDFVGLFISDNVANKMILTNTKAQYPIIQKCISVTQILHWPSNYVQCNIFKVTFHFRQQYSIILSIFFKFLHKIEICMYIYILDSSFTSTDLLHKKCQCSQQDMSTLQPKMPFPDKYSVMLWQSLKPHLA